MSPTPSSNKSSRKVLLIGVIGIVAAMIGIMTAQLLQPTPPQLQVATLLQPPRALPSFTLVNQDNQPFTSNQLANHWTLVFFGYTHCPDVCPTTLATLASVDMQLYDLNAEQRPRILFVSVDTLRDTPEKIKAYLQAFSPQFIGATGKQTDIIAVAQAFSAPVSIETKDNNITVDHSAAVFVVNPKGQLRAVFGGPHKIDSFTADLRQLVSRDR